MFGILGLDQLALLLGLLADELPKFTHQIPLCTSAFPPPADECVHR